MSYSDQLLRGQLGKRCHPLNLIDMFNLELFLEARCMSKIKLNKPFTHHSHDQEGHSMLASMNQYSLGLDTVMSCFIDKYFETFSGQI